MSLVVDLSQPATGDVSVDLGGAEAGVAEQFLHCPKVGSSFEEMGGEGVAQGVRANVMLRACANKVPVHHTSHASISERPATMVEE
jgi:hypothetical protein